MAVFFPRDRQGAEADPAGLNVQHGILKQQFDPAGIEGLFAQAADPPELRIVDCNGTPAVFQDSSNSFPGRGGNGQPGFDAGFQQLQIRPAVQDHFPVRVLLRIARTENPAAGDAPEADIPPQAKVRQDRAPVPAEHAMGLAKMRITGEGFRGTCQRALFLHLPGITKRGPQFHPETVLPGQEKLFYRIFPSPVHVVRFPEQRIVQKHPTQRIDALKGEDHLIRLQQRGVGHKSLFKGKIPLADRG